MKENQKLETEDSENDIDISMMGYDWIAHIVDNKSILSDQSDKFFDEIGKFRRENLSECNHFSKYLEQKTRFVLNNLY